MGHQEDISMILIILILANLDKLLSLQPRTFKWKSNHKEDWGLIAEEVDELGFKELVNYS